ncbi:MAG: hypothetical protein ABJH98_13965 [Reichenbachiella sp.]|uniref:hypothetical protein n=1 Tax=Reichenbachiella sp. TaxID=2184521 RepID=UPI003299FE1F
MKKLFIFCIGLCLCRIGICQVEKINNGYNLKEHCDPSNCKYFKFTNNVSFPQGEGTDWEMANSEIAVKNTGFYLLTGDMYVKGEEMGARLKFEIELFNSSDEIIFTTQTDLIEYYSEPGFAEPIVLSGKIPADIAKEMDFLNFMVIESETVPYYELATDCYGPCNNYQLNASIKALKKSK